MLFVVEFGVMYYVCMKVLVGSTNPVKIESVKEAFSMFFKDVDVDVSGVGVESGVSDQPLGEEETRMGARNRAVKLFNEVGTGVIDYGVGLEGGVVEIDGTLFECAWCVVRDKDGVEGIGGGLYFELPSAVADRLRDGGELGPVMDDLMGTVDIKKKGGAIGVFTNGVLNRKDAYVHLVLQALVKWGGFEY